MKKGLIILACSLSIWSFAQKNAFKLFENKSYSIQVPDTWISKNDNEIINIYPSSEVGAITISEYNDLNLPKEEIKKFILALHHSNDDESKVKTKTAKKGFTEYNYEYVDEEKKEVWYTRLFQKDQKLILLTITCNQKYWNGNYMKLFNESFNSFKINEK